MKLHSPNKYHNLRTYVTIIGIALVIFVIFLMRTDMGNSIVDSTTVYIESIRAKTTSTVDLITMLNGRQYFYTNIALKELINRGKNPLILSIIEQTALDDENINVRLRCNFILFRLRDQPHKRLQAFISDYLLLEPTEKSSIINFLSDFVIPEDYTFADEFLIASCNDIDEYQLNWIAIMRTLIRSETIQKYLIYNRLDDNTLLTPNVDWQLFAAQLIGDAGQIDDCLKGNQQLIEAGIILLQEGNTHTRAEAAISLGQHGFNWDSINALRDSFYNDPDQDVRLNSLISLENILPEYSLYNVVIGKDIDTDTRIQNRIEEILRFKTIRIIYVSAIVLLISITLITGIIAYIKKKKNLAS